MDRLTAWDNGNAYFPKCFEDPCGGCGCEKEICDFCSDVCRKLAQYEDIGTLEEVRDAVEKQKAKSPTYEGDGYAPDGTFVWDEWLCPHCGSRFEVDYDDYNYCPDCGQKIDWGEEE